MNLGAPPCPNVDPPLVENKDFQNLIGSTVREGCPMLPTKRSMTEDLHIQHTVNPVAICSRPDR